MHPARPASEIEPAAKACSDALARVIREAAAAAGGELPFDTFMELALYAPGLGYYMAGAHKLGTGGDFVTAPELSPLFGRCLAGQIGEALSVLAGGEVLEIGAGSGALAAEILTQLERDGVLPERYLILELSPELRQRQARRIKAQAPALASCVHWLSAMPQGLKGVVVANEVLDAMPVHRFRIRADGSIGEIFVAPRGQGWVEVVAPPSSPGLERAVRGLQAEGLATTPGYTSEVNLRLRPWIAGLAAAIDRALVLLIDFGYPRHELYRADRAMGTLMCHYRHEAHGDPYARLGLQDITAHVDFTALAEHAREAGLAIAGYATQAHFLLGCGLERLMAEAGQDRLSLALGAKQLLLPTAMGERFRVLGLTKRVEAHWCGFAVRDLRDRLWLS